MGKTKLTVHSASYTEYRDEEILPIIAQDNSKAFEHIFKKYYSELTRFSLKFIREESLAEEIVQEVFIKIWEKRKDIQLHTNLKSYLYTSVKNTTLNLLKSKFVQISVAEPNERDHQTSQNSEDELTGKELDQVLKKAVLGLPDKCRIIFTMSRQAGMSYKEIATELGISLKTVEAQMGIALKKLKLYLEKHWDQILLIIFILHHKNKS
ncbi:MAG: RNA polymerase sigma-70 factor [Microscillaceae bacterium]|nr:RNA polymerase sigma-70 factor [Microscillaceae bacterium]